MSRSLSLGTRCSLLLGVLALLGMATPSAQAEEVWRQDNLVAWCIVPFDAQRRGPEERAAMLEKIGIRRLAYDYRAEHIPTFDAEMEALRRHDIELTAWWFPTELNDEARLILDVLRRHNIQTQLWVTGGGEPTRTEDEQRQRVAQEAERIGRIARAAQKIGCSVALYNHGGWFGEPENQIAIIEHLGMDNVGIVYNLHHGHAHVERFPELLKRMMPHLMALNLNGMTHGGDQSGNKIMPIGAGELDVELAQAIEQSGYQGPIGILNHTDLDAEARLLDNLDGLRWVIQKMRGEEADRPEYRTWTAALPEEHADATHVERWVRDASMHGDPVEGIRVFASHKFACLGCHKIGSHGGTVGPALDVIGTTRTAAHMARSLLWPNQHVEDEYQVIKILTADGTVLSGYVTYSDDDSMSVRDASTGEVTVLEMDEIEAEQPAGSLMPEGLVDAMRGQQQRDLLALLVDLGRWETVSPEMLESVLAPWATSDPATFEYALGPMDPEAWTQEDRPVNRNRLYEFYTKQAEHFRGRQIPPPVLEAFPGLDGPNHGHWGNQDEETWRNDRWNLTDLGSLQCGVFRGEGVEVPRGVCVRLGDAGEMAACFNPDTLSYDMVWRGGFVKFSAVRHGFMDGLLMDGKPVPAARTPAVTEPFEYHGFYRSGKRVVFAYRIGDTEFLDSPWVEDGRFVRHVAPRSEHPLRDCVLGGPSQWPEEIPTTIEFGDGQPYAIDTIALPVDNPWNALIFCGDHDFLPDGDALVCTMQGDVWRVSGLDSQPEGNQPAETRWRRFASGLHQALGVTVSDDGIYVLGRDRITRLNDTNGDGEADFYESFCNAYETSPSGHDFICGLHRDAEGYFYTASGNQGLLRISPDGQRAEVIATGFRNPDGLGLFPDGTVTVPCSEGEWTPASMICAVRPGEAQPPFFGYGGPRGGIPPHLPMLYLPRGVDNSSGGQIYVDSDAWGPLRGTMVHLSFGAGTSMLVLRDEVDGQLQGAAVPLPGDFASGAHRGRFRPQDGQLYVSGMAGWGTYTSDDGCFQRMRYTGDRVQQPVDFHVHSNGIRITFSSELDPVVAEDPLQHFAQQWNYRYSSAYGSPEFCTHHAGMPGHDTLQIASAHVLEDGRTLFLELPDLQPVNQLHLRVYPEQGQGRDLFLTVHRLDQPFEDFSGYQYEEKRIAPHPILADIQMATQSLPNPWKAPIEGATKVRVRTAGNLSFETREIRAVAGEALALTLENPDVVPHNWALLRPGTERQVGEMANRLVSDPEGAARHYIPDTDDVLVYTDVVSPKSEFTIYFHAPEQPGRYPYLCTFPGHWMVMSGVLIVEPR